MFNWLLWSRYVHPCCVWHPQLVLLSVTGDVPAVAGGRGDLLGS